MSNFDTLCGIGYFRPKFLQRFANRTSYLIVHCLLACTQGMLFIYMSGVLSTIEKQFEIKSEHSAYMMSGNEFSQVLMIFFLPAFAKVRRTPLWIAVGMLLSCFGCLVIMLANFTFDHSDEIDVTGDNLTDLITIFSNSKNGQNNRHRLCKPELNLSHRLEQCSSTGGLLPEDTSHWGGVVLIFLGLFLTGFGTSVFYSLSMAYLDDNMTRKASPMYIAISFVLRLSGAFLGMLLSGGFLSMYVKPWETPNFGEADPRWIGAWWLGPPFIGALILIFAVLVAFFPRRLPIKDSQITDAAAKAKKESTYGKVILRKDTFLEKWSPIKRVFKNKLFVANLFATVTSMFITSGFGTFAPKFFQIWLRFRESTSGRNTGFMIFAQIFALIFGGFAISKWQPRAKYIAYWNIFASAFFISGILGLSFIDCERSPWIEKGVNYIALYSFSPDSSLLECAKSCNCDTTTFNPICIRELNLNIYSACLAGCTQSSIIEDYCQKDSCDSAVTNTTIVAFSNCTCLQKNLQKILSHHMLSGILEGRPLLSDNSTDVSLTVVKGECPSSEHSCRMSYYGAIAIMFCISFANNFGRIGSILIQIRCIDVNDKALSFAIVTVAMSMFAQLPAPLIYGHLFDASCAEFRDVCGRIGDCLHYDNELFRFWVLRVTCIIGLLPLVCDILVMMFVGNLDLYADPSAISGQQQQQNEEEEEIEEAETRF